MSFESNKNRIPKEEPKQSEGKKTMPTSQFFSQILQEFCKKSFNDFSNLLEQLQHLSIDSGVLPVIKYEDAISYFVNNRPNNSRVQKGAMLKDTHQKGYVFIQVFLDSENHLVCQDDGIPYGRKIVVEKFDDELSETFGNQGLVIVE